jgi:hypothetical protein
MAFTTASSASAPDWCTAAMTNNMAPIVPRLLGGEWPLRCMGAVVSEQSNEPRGCRP